VSASSPVDERRLAQWLQTRLDLRGSDAVGVTVERLAEGHSNLTYVVTRAPSFGEEAPRSWILRRPPAGPLLPTAHDVVREFRVLDLLGRSDHKVRVPRVVALCEDLDVIGAPFYLMDRVHGTVVRGEIPAWLGEAGRRALGLDLALALAEIHLVPPEPFVADGIGRPDGYLARQLRRWIGQREGIQVAVAQAGGRARELPDYDAVRDWLRAHLPDETPAAVVHGDYKLDNVIVSPPGDNVIVSPKGDNVIVSPPGDNVIVSPPGETGGPHVAAVVDWEMATVGDPRADLGYLLSFWPEPGETYPLPGLVTAGRGFPTRAELVHEWETATRRVAGELTWFVALAVWKLAVLLEASYHRHLAGSTDDPFFASLDQGVPALLAHAREICHA